MKSSRTILLLMVVVCSALISPAEAIVLEPGDYIVSDFNGAFGGYGGKTPPGSGRIIKVDPTTGAQTLISSGGDLDAPWSMAIDGLGNIIVVDKPYDSSFAAQVISINPATGVQQVISSGGLLTNPMGLSLDAAGNFIVSDAAVDGTGGIIKIDPTTGAQAVLASGGSFNGASGLAIDAVGDIYVNTTGSGSALNILKIDPDNGDQTLFSSGSSAAWHSGLAISDTGGIFASEIYYNNGIFKVDPTTGAQSILSNYGYFQDPWGLDVDPAGDLVVADANWFGTGRVVKVDSTTGAQTLISSAGLLVDPSDVVVYPSVVAVPSGQTGVVPEPSTFIIWILLGALGITFGWYRRRKAA